MVKTCLEPKCEKQAWYNYPNEDERIYCNLHFKENMVCKFTNTCIEENCTRTSYYNLKGENKALFCSTHKTDDMVNVLTKRCIEEDCENFPSFNFKTERNALYCGTHKHLDMINIDKARCKYYFEDGTKCMNQPLWNFFNETTPIYCGQHKKHDMILLNKVICHFENCEGTAAFNYPDKKFRMYCSFHKLDGMIDLKHKNTLCIIDDCNIQASYNVKDQKKPLYCSSHADKKTMCNVKNRICEIDNCLQRALFGQVGEKPRFCGTHRDGHPHESSSNESPAKTNKSPAKTNESPVKIITKENVDIVNKKCEVEGCNGHRIYGLNSKNTHCNKHKTDGMIKSVNITCKNKNCMNRALYGIIGGKPMYCEEHKNNEKNLVNMIEHKCKKCGLIEIMSTTEENICIYCVDNSVKLRLKKENIIRNLLDKNNIKYNSHNKIMNKNCDKYRPDFCIDMNTHMVILEVDEFQHSHYLCDCEYTRMFNISNAFGGLPVIWLRYNPDPYMIKNTRTNTLQKQRHELLLKYLTRHCLKPPSNLAEVIYLYYNDFDGERKVLIEYQK
tara:strand:- start:15164 stop:16834 length:1671 start_codon:yes stop_codon:yes gene_type:complete